MRGPELHHRRAPAAELRMGQREGNNVRVLREERVHRAAQIADAFAVDNAHLENASFAARGEVIRHQILNFARLKGVQVQHAINRQLDWPFVGHAFIIVSARRSNKPLFAREMYFRIPPEEASFPGMKIRKATLKDAAVIADFNLKLARESEALRLNPKTVGKGVRALLKDPAMGVYFLAEQSSKGSSKQIVGQLMVTFEWSDWRNGMFWWVQSVYVPEEFRGRGVFRTLYRHVLRLARKRGNVCGLRLYVEKKNERAFRAYEKLGMKETYYRIFDYPIFGGSAG